MSVPLRPATESPAEPYGDAGARSRLGRRPTIVHRTVRGARLSTGPQTGFAPAGASDPSEVTSGPEAEPPPPTLRQRAEEAGPLVVLAITFTIFAGVLHGEPIQSRVGSFALWMLFAALAVVAAGGALASMLLAESELPKPAPERRSVSPIGSPAERPDATLRSLRTPAPTIPPVVRPHRRTRSFPAPWEESAWDREGRPLAVARPSSAPDTGPRARADREPAGVTPEAALEEIDGVWRDLQQLRHFRRRRLPG